MVRFNCTCCHGVIFRSLLVLALELRLNFTIQAAVNCFFLFPVEMTAGNFSSSIKWPLCLGSWFTFLQEGRNYHVNYIFIDRCYLKL